VVACTEQSDFNCQPGGPPGNLCVEGYGKCCDVSYGTANAGPSPSACPTCYNGCVVCGEREFCADNCGCHPASPIIVDTTGKGFHLNHRRRRGDVRHCGRRHPVKLAWTAANSGNAFLALDRNHNGKIDRGKERFGNFTAQPKSDEPNGYLALAEFDKPQNGGNGDGIIDSRDAVSSKLLLWIDENHDGISQPYELHTLPELGVFSISLYYADDHHDDPYGNWFHYRAALNPDPQDGQSRDGRWSYDVFFDTAVGGAGEGGGHCRMIFEDRLDFGRDHPIGGGGIPPCKRGNSGGDQ
jgi:hypothetical protein